jgi:uncharacterized protein YdiU (UPF0061 family)
MVNIEFDNSYGRLSDKFYSRLELNCVSKPELIRINSELAGDLGIDPGWLSSKDGIDMISGNAMPDGADPLASVYAGHQFGHYVPRLGDGRALLIGELISRQGVRYDIQLKGSGPTPYSRGGDGRSPLGPVLREYIVSEAMHHLGVPTTRALGAVLTGNEVKRESNLPGAILTRVSQSHIRIGTHQYFAAYDDIASLASLVEHVIDRHYPEVKECDEHVLGMFQAVMVKQADLIANWQLLGFVHGVMNTDNMLLSGETIDYGPCAFIDGYNEHAVYSSIDRGGRYSYRNQPGICHWNLSCLAQSLLPLAENSEERALEDLRTVLNSFPELYSQSYIDIARRKFGLISKEKDDLELVENWFQILADVKDDFTLAFRRLSDIADESNAIGCVGDLLEFSEQYQDWIVQWKTRCSRDDVDPGERQTLMYSVNPLYMPRNHLVKNVIDAATENGDYGPFNLLVDVLANPYVFQPGLEYFAKPPNDNEIVIRTFCGT